MGFALPGDVEGGAVVHAGADDGEAKGGVYGGFEGDHLHGDVALIVIHADHGIEFLTAGRGEGGVGGHGAGDVNAFGGSGFQCGDDEAFFFTFTEQAVLAGVGIQAADEQLRSVAADEAQGVVGEFDDFEDAFAGDELGHFVVADVDGDKAAGDRLRVLHHAGAGGVHALGEDLGVTGELVAGGVEGFFVQRRGGDAVDFTGESGLDGSDGVGVSRITASGGDLAGNQGGGINMAEIQD